MPRFNIGLLLLCCFFITIGTPTDAISPSLRIRHEHQHRPRVGEPALAPAPTPASSPSPSSSIAPAPAPAPTTASDCYSAVCQDVNRCLSGSCICTRTGRQCGWTGGGCICSYATPTPTPTPAPAVAIDANAGASKGEMVPGGDALFDCSSPECRDARRCGTRDTRGTGTSGFDTTLARCFSTRTGRRCLWTGTACVDADDEAERQRKRERERATSSAPSNNLWQQLQFYNTSLSLLVNLINDTRYEGVRKILESSSTSLTLLAPNNLAVLNAIATGRLDPNDTARTLATLNYHLLDHPTVVKDFSGMQYPRTQLNDEAYVQLGGQMQVVKASDLGLFGPTLTYCDPTRPLCTSRIAIADILASNGAIHVIDSLMNPPLRLNQQLVQSGLTTLLAALALTDLSGEFQNASSTIFAPTDAAFAKVPWKQMPLPMLKSLLLYHVVPEAVYAGEGLINGHELPTVNGKHIVIASSKDRTRVKLNDNAHVLVEDVLITNGVIHIVDAVLLPLPLATMIGLSSSDAQPASQSAPPVDQAKPSIVLSLPNDAYTAIR